MKKTLVAVAVTTAAFTAVTAQAADVDTYGNIQLVYADGEDTAELTDNGSTFGFKGEKELKHGLTGFFKYELEADADEKTNDVDVNLDQAYVGLKGDFGKVQIGTYDSIYNNAIQDGINSFEYADLTELTTTDEGDTIAYFSPEVNGFEVQVSAQVKGDAEDEVADDSVEEGTALTAVVKYSAGDLEIAAGYDSLNNELDAEETIGFSAAYNLGVANVMAKYEDNSDEGTNIGFGFNADYTDGLVYGSIQAVEVESGSDYDEYAVGVTYNLDLDGDVYVYVEAGQQGTAEDSFSALGAVYAF
ncbi:porin [Marinomonas sp. MED121]|uniref:porin n=1 Tax=Marinomonas sp. MED121 TaxID=314277 RepID=UPI000069039A|nr:porin [Marinomonas sp. MED121]EAQ66160.1 porin [Marinomonas sp. MED121]